MEVEFSMSTQHSSEEEDNCFIMSRNLKKALEQELRSHV